MTTRASRDLVAVASEERMPKASKYLLLLVFTLAGGCATSSASRTEAAPTGSPLKSSEGPFVVTARTIRLRGSDQQLQPKPEIRIENNLRIEKICDIRITRDGNWSPNMLVTKDCLVPTRAAIVIPPEPGEWTIKVETNASKTHTTVVELLELPVGVSFAD
jgi:hypothetical protein